MATAAGWATIAAMLKLSGFLFLLPFIALFKLSAPVGMSLAALGVWAVGAIQWVRAPWRAR